MLTRFFNKTNPSNYALLFLLLIVNALTVLIIKYLNQEMAFDLLKSIGSSLCVLLSLFFINLTIRGLNLHKHHLLGGFIFVIFTFFMPNLFYNLSTAFSLLLLSFALYRLFYLKAVKAAIFEFSFLIICAAFFNYWMLLFLVFLVIFIMFFNKFDFKNLLIPIVAFFAVFIIVSTIDILFKFDLKQTFLINNSIQINIENFSSTNQRLVFSILITFILLFVVLYFLQSEHISANIKSYYTLLFVFFVISVFVFLVDEEKHNEKLIFTIIPISIFGGRYLENLRDKKLKGFISWVFVITAIGMFVISL